MTIHQPYRLCPRFKECSVNNCPLHPNYPNVFTDPADSEPRCTLAKPYRVKVAEKFPGVLRYGGLTTREYSGKSVWESLTPEEQERRKEVMKKYAFTSVSQEGQDKVRGKEGGRR